ncbi:MAG: SDR family NAD(P)-dependent oxidoreductase [Steroidobacteraceae bacterium]
MKRRGSKDDTRHPDPSLDRRQFLGGLTLAAAVAAGGSREVHAAAAPTVGNSQPPPLKDLAGKVAYITGASSGIGLATARLLHDAGMKVVLGYIVDDQIKEAMTLFKADDPDVFSIKHDVLDRDGWERTADEIDKRFGKTHLLVNNAGVGLNARATAASVNDWDWGMGVNVWGPVNGLRTFLPRFRAHNEGAHIATVGSISGMFAGSGNGVYTVSKYAVCGLMEELRVELHDTNIGTSILFPGFTASNIGRAETYRPDRFKNAGGAAPPPRPAPAAGAAPAAPRAADSQMDPMECARCLIDGIRNNDLFILSHPEWRIGTKARLDAIMASFIDRPVPAARVPTDPYRTPVYLQEIEHRRRTAKRDIKSGG